MTITTTSRIAHAPRGLFGSLGRVDLAGSPQVTAGWTGRAPVMRRRRLDP